MITCPHCGYQAPDGTPWCPNCGYGRPDPMQPKQPPVAPPPPPPAPPQKQDSSSCGGNCLAVILMVVVLILFVLMVIGIGGRRSEPKPTPTLIPSETPTSGPTEIPTITPTPKAVIPDYCGDELQMSMIRMADVLDADGHPSPYDYIETNNMCVYRIADDDSFLLMDTLGELDLFFDENDQLYMTNLSINYKDSDRIREVIRDWGAISISVLDQDTNILTAQSAVNQIIASGAAETTNSQATGSLHTDQMIYRIVVRDKSILQ